MIKKLGWIIFDAITAAVLITTLVLGLMACVGDLSDTDRLFKANITQPNWQDGKNGFDAAYAMAISGTTLAGITIIPVGISIFLNFFKHKKEWGWAIFAMALAFVALGMVIFSFVKHGELQDMIDKLNPVTP